MTKDTNTVEFEVWGNFGLFTDPLTRGGERMSYQLPTYQALVGITSSIYWKPTLIWRIDDLRVMNTIKVESKAIRPLDKNFALDKNTLAYYTYLVQPRYQVRAHFVWNMQRPDLEQDRNAKKHMAIFQRALKAGGREDVFLGTRECQGYVKPISFGTGEGAYDNQGKQLFGTMVHGYNYPDETGDPTFAVRLWTPTMQDGIVHFLAPDQCKIVQPIRKIKNYHWQHPNTMQSVDILYDAMFGGESK
ncbi:type I-C CRISPR-associated protein Cas5c [Schleiferilactobacillus perolens]|nr:type I-C CRISPR-associated protein Cas5c [Schleiferilactobacillus perolens]